MKPFSVFSRRALLLTLVLDGCATAIRGSHTEFEVQTYPPGASVTTDRLLEGNPLPTGTSPQDADYYGCAPTPCSYRLPRRSDFNILITHPGYQPFTWAVTKMRRKDVIKKNESANIKTASGTSVGYIGTALASPGGGLGTLTAPAAIGLTSAAILLAEPVFFSANTLDLASGALIELYPNPLNVKLVKEKSPDDSKTIVETFRKTRLIHRQQGY